MPEVLLPMDREIIKISVDKATIRNIGSCSRIKQVSNEQGILLKGEDLQPESGGEEHG